MKIIFTPQARFDSLVVSVSGDSVVINGKGFDFSSLPDGQGIAVDSVWFAGDVRRLDGNLHVPLIYPHGVLQPDAVPGVVVLDVIDGVVDVPSVD